MALIGLEAQGKLPISYLSPMVRRSVSKSLLPRKSSGADLLTMCVLAKPSVVLKALGVDGRRQRKTSSQDEFASTKEESES